MKRLLLAFIFLLLLAACTSTTEAPAPDSVAEGDTAPSASSIELSSSGRAATETIPPPVVTVDTPRVEPPTATSAGSAQAVPTPEPAEEQAVAEGGVVSGRTPEGAFFLGDPNAPITHIDYSDFL